LASKVFIGVGWACDGFKATMALRQPCQSRYWRALARTQFIRCAVNFLGDAIRDAIDPRIRHR